MMDLNKDVLFLWLDEWAASRGLVQSAPENSGADEFGAVRIRAIDVHRSQLAAAHANDREVLGVIESEPARYLWKHDATTADQARAIDANNGEREAFLGPRLGLRRFCTPYDHYEVRADGTLKKGARHLHIAVAYQTAAGEAAGLGDYTAAEIARIENDALSERISNLLRGRAERAAAAQTFKG